MQRSGQEPARAARYLTCIFPLLSRQQFLRGSAALAGLTACGALRGFAQSKPTVFVTAYSHIDPAWLWPLQEGLQQAYATFRSLLDLLRDRADLVVSQTAASYYRWVRETDPRTFARVKRAAAAGRWDPLGGWWTEADLNVPSGEALMRQASLGQREFLTAFGRRARVAFLPDSFGSPANMPAILRAQGFSAYVFGRGVFADGSSPPAERFVWRGLGNSSIIAYRLPVAQLFDDAVGAVRAAAALHLVEPPLIVIGVSDHGGGPSRASLDALDQYARQPDAPQVVFTTVDSYFRNRPAPSAVRFGELEGAFPGSYANAADLKRANFEAQRVLVDTERFDALAYLLLGDVGQPPQLDDLWEVLLRNQHHDTISGTGLRANILAATREDKSVATLAREQSERSLERSVDSIDNRDPSAPLLAVFNPLDRPVRAPVIYPLGLFGNAQRLDDQAAWSANTFTDATGADVPFQIAHAERGSFPGTKRPLIMLVGLPAFGYATVRQRIANRTPYAVASLGERQLANDEIALRLDALTGQPVSLVHRRTGAELLRGAGRLAVFSDPADTWGSQGQPVGATAILGAFQASKFELIENGPVRQVLRAWSSYGRSSAVQDWILYAGESQVRTVIEVAWHEVRARLGLALTPAFHPTAAEYDIPFGRIQRALDEAVHPASSMVAISDGGASLTIIAAGSHAFWASADSIGVTLLRSGPFASLGDQSSVVINEEGAQDIGDHRLALAIRAGDGTGGAVAEAAEAFDRDFPALWVGVHPGSGQPHASAASVDPGVTLPSVRRAADGKSFLVRVHDTTGRAHHTHVRLGSWQWSGWVDAFGVATVQMSESGAREIVEA